MFPWTISVVGSWNRYCFSKYAKEWSIVPEVPSQRSAKICRRESKEARIISRRLLYPKTKRMGPFTADIAHEDSRVWTVWHSISCEELLCYWNWSARESASRKILNIHPQQMLQVLVWKTVLYPRESMALFFTALRAPAILNARAPGHDQLAMASKNHKVEYHKLNVIRDYKQWNDEMAESETGLPTEPQPSYRQTRLHSSWENAWGSRWSPHLAMDVWKMPWDSTRCRPLRGFRSWKLLMYYITYIPRLQSCEAHTCAHTHTRTVDMQRCQAAVISCVVCEYLDVIFVCIYIKIYLFKGYKPISIYICIYNLDICSDR